MHKRLLHKTDTYRKITLVHLCFQKMRENVFSALVMEIFVLLDILMLAHFA